MNGTYPWQLIRLWPHRFCVAAALVCCTAAAVQPDPLTNPNAVKHQIDRSAMTIQLQGWSRDLRFPVYPVQVQRGSFDLYYITNEHFDRYEEFDFEELRCEIGDAPRDVLKLKGYACADGVCMTAEGAIVGTDFRRPASRRPC